MIKVSFIDSETYGLLTSYYKLLTPLTNGVVEGLGNFEIPTVSLRGSYSASELQAHLGTWTALEPVEDSNEYNATT